jgi:hypothetical protein
MESARGIPVAHSVDVLVVGGSTYAVAAATAAAKAGVSVFLAAPRPYLGEDLCATFRLVLPAGREPQTALGRRLFTLPADHVKTDGVPFTYETDRPSAARHRDSMTPSRLSDTRWDNAPSDSVQYDGDVTIIADLGRRRGLSNVRLLAFSKPGDYGVAAMGISAGITREGCSAIAEMAARTVRRKTARWSAIELAAPCPVEARFVTVTVTKPADCGRVLLGELVIEPDITSAQAEVTTTPHCIKSVLDDELIEAGVQFLYGCYPTDVLADADGKPAGIVMANRAGRQAVTAKVVIDATDRAVVARLAGAQAKPWAGGVIAFERAVLSPDEDGTTCTVQHTLELPMPDASFPSYAQAEQVARDRSYRVGQLRASAFLHHVPPDPLFCERSADQWRSGAEPDLGHFRPRGVERVYVLSGSADLPGKQAARLLAPLGLLAIGGSVGMAAARDAHALPDPTGVHVVGAAGLPDGQADVLETLQGLRPTDRDLPTVPSPARGIPLLAEYDVVVVGGGTAGAAAGIAAARRGARTLVVEYLEGLGGVATLGLIGKAYHGRNVGFAAEVPFPNDDINIEDKMEWFRRELRKAGADIWFGVLGCGAYVSGQRVSGVVVATPQGRGVILAGTTIDATGNGEIAIAAGADYMYGADEDGIALQGTGLPVRPLRRHYVNSDYLLVDETDMVDVWRTFAGVRDGLRDSVFDTGTLIQTRERRRVVGDHILRYLDQIVGRTYRDSIVFSASDYDSHGYPNRPYFALLPHDEKSLKANHPAPGGTCYTPYRCLLPKGLDGVLVVGVGISMERDASAMVRMQRDVHNQGYAAGIAGAMATESGVTVRNIDIRVLQRHLVDTGALPEEVLRHQVDSMVGQQSIADAVEALPDAANPAEAGRSLAIILSSPERARPVLEEAFGGATGPARLTYAKVLGVFGDARGVPELTEALDDITAWDAKILQGVAAEYAHLPTPVDALILSLGSTRDSRALPSILRKLDMLDAETTLSHHRAVALALERLAPPTAARPLASLLTKPGMRGHAMTALEPLYNAQREKRRRTGPLREIVLARALFRCGDHDGIGEAILREYCRDIRGLFARHAHAVLEAGCDYRPQ